MKKLMIVFFILLTGGSVIAAILGGFLFSPEPFDIEIIQHQHMLSIPNKEFSEIDVDYTFTDSKKTYQLRYSLFKQIENTDEDIMMPYSMFILPLMLNISGNESSIRSTQRFNDADVKNDFNGDFGTTVYIERPRSEFGGGYRYLILNFYCKKNQGIVVQSILFNNMNIMKNENFVEIFNSFKFR